MKKIILSYNFGGAKEQLNDLDDIYKIDPYNLDEIQKKLDLVMQLSQEEKII